jgi:hypothetical protein
VPAAVTTVRRPRLLLWPTCRALLQNAEQVFYAHAITATVVCCLEPYLCATRGSPFLFPPSRASFLCSRNYRALLNHDDHCHHHISTQTPPSNECVLTTAPPPPMSISLAETSQATRISIFPCRRNILGECHPLATSF